jgi:hypothetical protein
MAGLGASGVEPQQRQKVGFSPSADSLPLAEGQLTGRNEIACLVSRWLRDAARTDQVLDYMPLGSGPFDITRIPKNGENSEGQAPIL